MHGFLLVRGWFIGAVVYASVLIQPLQAPLVLNGALGWVIALVIVAAEAQMRDTAVTQLKEGKEDHQGVAYLDDGTVVVIVVTSVPQTTAGRMIFGRHVDAAAGPSPVAWRDDVGRRPRPVAQA